jgi:protein-S-isoprenylcysteine O-methyltransferase Ste14
MALWWLRREYQRRGKLTWLGSIAHVAIYAAHGMFSALLVWGSEEIPPMGPGGGLGIVLMILGGGITVSAMDLFRRFTRWLGNDTPGLTTSGLYRFSRNPQFVGYGLFILGFFIAWWTGLAIIGLLAYMGLVYAVARVEEEHLRQVYGQPYLEYCARVPRFLGLPRSG